MSFELELQKLDRVAKLIEQGRTAQSISALSEFIKESSFDKWDKEHFSEQVSQLSARINGLENTNISDDDMSRHTNRISASLIDILENIRKTYEPTHVGQSKVESKKTETPKINENGYEYKNIWDYLSSKAQGLIFYFALLIVIGYMIKECSNSSDYEDKQPAPITPKTKVTEPSIPIEQGFKEIPTSLIPSLILEDFARRYPDIKNVKWHRDRFYNIPDCGYEAYFISVNKNLKLNMM